MTARELNEVVTSFGQQRAARKLALDEKLVPAEKLATMADIDVYEKLAEKFEIVATCCGGDRVILVRKEDEDKLWKMVKCLDR